MRPNKRISEWKYILLDTSFIVDFLSNPDCYDSNPVKKENIEIAQQIMNVLNLRNEKERPVFYISSITIGELRRLTTKTIFKELISTFSCGDVAILPYGKLEARIVADLSNNYMAQKQPRAVKNMLKDCDKYGAINLRTWISDDMKIISCAKYQYDNNKLDVILTSDKRTFLPVADFLKIPCMTLDKECFPKDLFGKIDI